MVNHHQKTHVPTETTKKTQKKPRAKDVGPCSRGSDPAPEDLNLALDNNAIENREPAQTKHYENMEPDHTKITKVHNLLYESAK